MSTDLAEIQRKTEDMHRHGLNVAYRKARKGNTMQRNEFNGWTNKETWLVNVWYMDSMPEYFADSGQYYVEPQELEETVQYIAEECEALSQLPAGLLSDFINDSWGEVNWSELCEALNEDLKEREEIDA